MVLQRTPDAGKSYFWYDRLGRLAVSRNAKQFYAGNQYSYTLYDNLGRITEVGQKLHTSSMTQLISQDAAALDNWLVNTGGAREQITGTIYDQDFTATNEALKAYLNQQHNLRNRVSYTYTRKVFTDAQNYSGTYYTYDAHGNVDTLLQNYSGVAGNTADGYKLITYRYDLISGKVNSVSYQPGKDDAFYHRYQYDAENRITEVFTSRDNLVWDREAAYSYYAHGPLARTVMGQQQVQGIDYTYTLQGWLKGINNNVSASGCAAGSGPFMLAISSRSNNQPLKYNARDSILFLEDFASADNDEFEAETDATLTACQSGGAAGGLLSEADPSTVARDAYGFSLHYYPGDYRPIAVPAGATGILDALGANASPLYNGNIAAMAVSVPQLGDAKVYNYRYDQLNRLSQMNVFNGLNTANGTFTPVATDDYKESVTYDPNGNITAYRRNGYVISGSQTVDMDKLRYNYLAGSNKLDYVHDSVGTTASYTTDLEAQTAGNYAYDSIGNLIKDNSAGITNVQWTVYGKIDNIQKGSSYIYYSYDAAGNRVSKIADGKTTLYVRDASGNVMAVYERVGTGAYQQTETHLYGSSRLGLQEQLTVAKQDVVLSGGLPTGALRTFTRGEKLFEIGNHLGNVLATVSDRRVQVGSGSTLNYYTADVVSAQDYYPFGMLQPGRSYNPGGYRYGFNGKENDNEVKGEGNQQDYGMRIYDPRIGKFLSVDPITNEYPELTPYQFASNRPIDGVDLDGLEYWGNPGGQANQSYIAQLFTPKAKQIPEGQLSAQMAAVAKAEIKINAKIAPVIVIGTIGFLNPAIGIPLALSYLTGAPVLPAPQAMAGPVVATAAAEAGESAAVAAAGTETAVGRVAAAAPEPIVVSDDFFGALKELVVKESSGKVIASMENVEGNVNFLINTKESSEFNKRGVEVFDALFAETSKRGAVNSITGNWSRGPLSSNLNAFNKAVINKLGKMGASFESLTTAQRNALLQESAFETFTGTQARKMGFKNASIVRTDGTPGSFFSVEVKYTK